MLKISGKADADIKDDCKEAVDEKHLKYSGEFSGPKSMTWDAVKEWRDGLAGQRD